MSTDPAVRDRELWSTGDGKSRAARTVEILLTLSRFGFGELIERSWWARWLPGRPADEAESDSHEAGAVEHYKTNPAALHLRAMNMVFEGLKKKGSMIIVPSTAVETMGLGAMGGLTAFDRILGTGKETEKSDDEPAKPGGEEE